MNPAIYRQYDSRWGSLPYPGKGSNLSNSGCGCFAVLHCAIELNKYKNLTPQECRKYMVQYATVKNGTLWAGITKGLQHYGYKVHWNQNDGMSTIFKELENSCKKGVILFIGGTAPNGTKWTSGGHYVAFSDYRVKDGRHEFYCKDSGARKHDGWYSYERSMRGCIRNVWICKSADDKPAPKPQPVGKLSVDGVGGTKTVRRMQEFLNCPVVDGVIGGQLRKHESLFPALKSVAFGKGGSTCILKLQMWLGLSGPDGYLGPNTVKAWQKRLKDLGYYTGKIDGNFAKHSMKAWQEALNNDCKKKVTSNPSPSPTPSNSSDPLQKWYDAMTTQFNWSKNQKYKFNEKPTVANSKKEGTCITFPAVALQRIGLLPSGKYFYFYPKTKKIAGNAASYVKKHTEIFSLSYPNKTIAQLGNNIKKGDIVGFDNPAYHTMVYMGKNSKGEPIFNTMGHKRGLKVTYASYAKRKINMLVRIKKI